MVLLKLKPPKRHAAGTEGGTDGGKPHTGSAPSGDNIQVTGSATKAASSLRSSRSRHSAPTTTPPVGTRHKTRSKSNAEDVINVQSRMAAAAIRDEGSDGTPLRESDDVEEAPRKTKTTPLTGKHAAPNRPWAPAGKAPVRDAVLTDADSEMTDADIVEEYNFSGESEDEDDDDGQDTEWYKVPTKNGVNVITISSDDDMDDRGSEWDLHDRPWKEMDERARFQWEMMYCTVADFPMGNDWSRTEDFQREKDKEMLRYIEDFPLPQWVLPGYLVTDAYNRLLERTRWRTLGIHIYGRERIPEWIPGSTKPMQRSYAQTMKLQTPLNMPSDRYPRESPSSSHPPNAMAPPPMRPSMSNGAMPYNFPPPGMQQPTMPAPPLPPSAPPVLHSQPNMQPIPTYPNGMPIYQPTGTIGLPSGAAPHMSHLAAQPPRPMYPLAMANPLSAAPTQINKSKGRARKYATPPTEVQAPPPKTPPYERREKPTERRAVNKTGRRNMRRQAEAEEFPWNRQLNFPEARANATWDASGHDQATLISMAATRKRNEPIIERIDQQEAERQRQTRLAKKQGPKNDGSSDAEKRKSGPKRKSSMLSTAEGGTGDPYHSGHYCFATQEDEERAKAFGNRGPDDIMQAVEEGFFSIDSCKDLMICWNPGKKGVTQDLEQARFSIKDTLLTRQQLETTPILTRRAAECIVDFCPDLLWRGMLLRIASEAGYGNKDVRDRMCLNGNYCDKATITKRIGSALGQKQQQSGAKAKKKAGEAAPVAVAPPVVNSTLEKVKGYAKGEDEYYNNNVIDFAHYVEYFGKRTSHRGQLNLRAVGSKRKAITMEADELDASSGAEGKAAGPGTLASDGHDTMDEDGDGDDAGVTSAIEVASDDVEEDPDAVSVQSDTLLDEMEED